MLKSNFLKCNKNQPPNSNVFLVKTESMRDMEWIALIF